MKKLKLINLNRESDDKYTFYMYVNLENLENLYYIDDVSEIFNGKDYIFFEYTQNCQNKLGGISYKNGENKNGENWYHPHDSDNCDELKCYIKLAILKNNRENKLNEILN